MTLPIDRRRYADLYGPTVGDRARLGLRKRALPVANTRAITKADLIHNNATPASTSIPKPTTSAPTANSSPATPPPSCPSPSGTSCSDPIGMVGSGQEEPTPMSIRLAPHVEALIRQKMDTGTYRDADAVAEDALHVVDEREQT